MHKVGVRGSDFSNCGWTSFSFSEKVLASLCSVERAENFEKPKALHFLGSVNITREKIRKQRKSQNPFDLMWLEKFYFFKETFHKFMLI